jgi:hypothetical protein
MDNDHQEHNNPQLLLHVVWEQHFKKKIRARVSYRQKLE